MCFHFNTLTNCLNVLKHISLTHCLQVLTDPDHCYCVVLNANDGAAFPCENSSQNSPRDSSSVKTETSAGEMKSSKV